MSPLNSDDMQAKAGRAVLVAVTATAAWALLALLAALSVAVPAAASTAAPGPASRLVSVASRTVGSPQPWPVTITIRTVPALPGIRFLFDGSPLVTGPQGTTSFTERHNFDPHALQLTQTRLSLGQRQYEFARWAGQRDPNQAFRPTVTGLPMRADYTVTASFSVTCQVRPRLVQQDGAPLSPGMVSHIGLRSSLGQSATLAPSGTSWLPCARPVYRDSQLYSRDVGYSVQEMLVDGTNVVHAGVQRFSPIHTPAPTVTGYFYALTITAHDALFGDAIGSYALLTMPDQAVRKVMLGHAHTATVANLPEGNYRVQVKANGADIPALDVHLSKDQTANLAAVSHADLALTGGVFTVAVAGIPLLSRARRHRVRAFLRSRILRRGRGPVTEVAGLRGRATDDPVPDDPGDPGRDESGGPVQHGPSAREQDEQPLVHPALEQHAEEEAR